VTSILAAIDLSAAVIAATTIVALFLPFIVAEPYAEKAAGFLQPPLDFIPPLIGS
jgi:hypothetical protein